MKSGIVCLSQLTSETRKVVVEFKDLIQLIDDEAIKKNPIESAKFTVGGQKFSISVCPEDPTLPHHIGVYLGNHSDKDQTTSYKMKHASGVDVESDMIVIKARHGRGFPKFLSHEKYKEWVNKNGDIFRVEVSVTLHIKDNPAPEVPIPLRPEGVISSVNKVIMEDDSTTDFSLRCETKTFRVHSSFLCARSPVFRAMVQGTMQEAENKEIFIKELDEKTLESVITFVYTGELEVSDNMDVQQMVWAGHKYELAGFIELLSFKLKQEKNIKHGTIADMLIAAYRHNKVDLRAEATERIRINRNIMKEEEFRENMKDHGIVLLELIKDL